MLKALMNAEGSRPKELFRVNGFGFLVFTSALAFGGLDLPRTPGLRPNLRIKDSEAPRMLTASAWTRRMQAPRREV